MWVLIRSWDAMTARALSLADEVPPFSVVAVGAVGGAAFASSFMLVLALVLAATLLLFLVVALFFLFFLFDFDGFGNLVGFLVVLLVGRSVGDGGICCIGVVSGVVGGVDSAG